MNWQFILLLLKKQHFILLLQKKKHFILLLQKEAALYPSLAGKEANSLLHARCEVLEHFFFYLQEKQPFIMYILDLKYWSTSFFTCRRSSTSSCTFFVSGWGSTSVDSFPPRPAHVQLKTEYCINRDLLSKILLYHNSLSCCRSKPFFLQTILWVKIVTCFLGKIDKSSTFNRIHNSVYQIEIFLSWQFITNIFILNFLLLLAG